MPRGDRSGPNGAGSRTGRGLGLCSGSSTAGYLNDTGVGRGRGFRNGGGRSGRGGRFGYAFSGKQYVENSETSSLQNEIESIKNTLNGFAEKLSELTK